VSAPSTSAPRACHCCGLVQHLPEVPTGARARCARCHTTLWRPGRKLAGNRRCAAAALAALILYPVAVSLPIMRLERFGHLTEASIWSGTFSLLAEGQILVGIVVLACSVVIPLLKLAGLLLITTGRLSHRNRAFTYRLIEWAGRWGMLDVLLIAILVAWIKVGDLMEVHPGPAALAFTVCVCLSLVATACFDPHALWEEAEDE